MKAPYTMFGRTRLVRVVTWSSGKVDKPPKKAWGATLWIERPEDSYALMSDELKSKTVRLVYREDWLNADEETP